MNNFPKRLIEVDLPIKRISEYARIEKNKRRGHVPLLHIWPATRPPAACRAVICSLLWPDPSDENCPESFRETARKLMLDWSNNNLKLMSEESYNVFNLIRKDPKRINNNDELREALLNYIADFSNWDNSTNSIYIEISKKLTFEAHKSLNNIPSEKPILIDPFAGGGAIPLEGLKVGCDVFSSDLNPVPILINKVILDYIPKYRQKLIEETKRWGKIFKKEAFKKLNEYYPVDDDGAIPITYIWARTIKCQGPNCGINLPLIRSLILVRKRNRRIGISIISNGPGQELKYKIVKNENAKEISPGTVKRGAAVCPACGFTTPSNSVRKQLIKQQGGAKDATLIAVVTINKGKVGRSYRLPNDKDMNAVVSAQEELQRRINNDHNEVSLLPDDILPEMSGVFNAPLYGHNIWSSLFSPRQSLAISSMANILVKLYADMKSEHSKEFSNAIITCLALMFDKMIDMNSALCGWQPHAEIPAHTFVRWAIPMVWDFSEVNPLAGSSGSPESALKRTIDGLKNLNSFDYDSGNVSVCSATKSPLPDSCVSILFTDPPYYNAIPYADISDFFYVWLKRTVGDVYPSLFAGKLAPKSEEICEMSGWDPIRYKNKDRYFFEQQMTFAFKEGLRLLSPNGICGIVFAHKSTEGWEALVKAIIDAGWVITASWPIDTEMQTRSRARNSATLSSSIHLVCRSRRDFEQYNTSKDVGDWRDVLQALPIRIKKWMSKLEKNGIVGADAIFSCLGPTLELFSKYSSVEKASGEIVQLREFLEQVWAAIAREALNMIFEGADTSGFEEDARLTAMWLWTLRTDLNNGAKKEKDEDKSTVQSGYTLDFDAARKIAQGLGVHLESLDHLVEIKGDKALLLSAGSRIKYLFGNDSAEFPKVGEKQKAKQLKLDFPDEFKQIEKQSSGLSADLRKLIGGTVLDQLHQSMILFAAGRGEALKRFLIEDGIGRNPLYWRLAQSLSALYPSGTDEKRWVDGVLARKKSFGF